MHIYPWHRIGGSVMSLKINLAACPACTLISPKPVVGEAVCFPGGSVRDFVADQSCTGVDVLFGVNGAPALQVSLWLDVVYVLATIVFCLCFDNCSSCKSVLFRGQLGSFSLSPSKHVFFAPSLRLFVLPAASLCSKFPRGHIFSQNLQQPSPLPLSFISPATTLQPLPFSLNPQSHISTHTLTFPGPHSFKHTLPHHTLLAGLGFAFNSKSVFSSPSHLSFSLGPSPSFNHAHVHEPSSVLTFPRHRVLSFFYEHYDSPCLSFGTIQSFLNTKDTIVEK